MPWIAVQFTSGSGNWAAIGSQVAITITGGGAAGGTGDNGAGTGFGGGAGGAGGSVYYVATVVPGSLIAYSVGAAGTCPGSASDGTDGGTTTASQVSNFSLTANGGKGGTWNGNGGLGGAGGTAFGGTGGDNITGNAGTNHSPGNNVGGNGGDCNISVQSGGVGLPIIALGGPGGASGTNGSPGTFPGAGGGGGGKGQAALGGAGASGVVQFLYWSPPTVSPLTVISAVKETRARYGHIYHPRLAPPIVAAAPPAPLVTSALIVSAVKTDFDRIRLTRVAPHLAKPIVTPRAPTVTRPLIVSAVQSTRARYGHLYHPRLSAPIVSAVSSAPLVSKALIVSAVRATAAIYGKRLHPNLAKPIVRTAFPPLWMRPFVVSSVKATAGRYARSHPLRPLLALPIVPQPPSAPVTVFKDPFLSGTRFENPILNGLRFVNGDVDGISFVQGGIA